MTYHSNMIPFEQLSDTLRTKGKEYAKAVALWEMLDESKKSVLAKCSTKYEGSEATRERQARIDKEFKEYLSGVMEARQKMLELKYEIDSLNMEFEYNRSMNSLRKMEMNLT